MTAMSGIWSVWQRWREHQDRAPSVDRMPAGEVQLHDPRVMLPAKDRVLTRMEDLIHHFMLVIEGMRPPPGEVYCAIESPKGELGFYLVSDGGKSAYRLKIRSPSFVALQALPKLVEGRFLSDVVAIVGSLDPVMGEARQKASSLFRLGAHA